MAAASPILTARDLVKSYGGVTALDGAGIALAAGEVHALVGENGAGKSTLVRMLLGIERPDGGTVELEGAPRPYAGARQAAAAGIAVVAQELSLFPDLTVLENLYPYGPPRRAGLTSPSRARDGAREVLTSLGLAHVPWDTPLGRLDLADRQLVEISRALLGRPRVLVLDEPTSALPVDAVERLFAVIRRLVGGGLAVLYISHFLEEVRRLADRISVLRDGRTVMRGAPAGEVSLDALVAAMLGDGPPPAATAPRSSPAAPTADRIGFTGVSAAGGLRDVTFEAVAGEVTGFAGLRGAGHLTVLDIVCGRARPATGQVTLPGGEPPPRDVSRAVAAGVAFVPGDRKRYGLMPDRTVWENTSAASWLARGDGSPWLRRSRHVGRALAHARRLRLQGTPYTPVHALSGGNQQKVVFAKWLDIEPRVVVLDDPTRGVDIGARAEMHAIVRGLAAAGRTVLVTSTDLAELAELCDRVLVLRRGRIAGELSGAALTEHALSLAMNAGPTGPEPGPGLGPDTRTAADD
ncbi:sugar ABC transporter ATP-binding protein [Actinacidiphila glaucinigra]|uniref:sugar ABC transporter ATP-binding protein n=1 Tax=Actinacidiphila glaucinigra TaxID=235986 RepID=UPI003672DB82